MSEPVNQKMPESPGDRVLRGEIRGQENKPKPTNRDLPSSHVSKQTMEGSDEQRKSPGTQWTVFGYLTPLQENASVCMRAETNRRD